MSHNRKFIYRQNYLSGSRHVNHTTLLFQLQTLAIVLLSLIFNGQEVLSINSVLDLNGTFPYLINKTTGQVIEPRDYMDFENIYAPNETYKLQQTAQGRNYHLLKAFDFANYYQSDYWHYSSVSDLRRSAQPVADKDKCAQYLDWIELQLNKTDGQALFKSGEQHLNLMTLMDSFGRPEAGTYAGHGYWLGSYNECIGVSIDTEIFEFEECRSNAQSSTKPCNQQVDGQQQNISTATKQLFAGQHSTRFSQDQDHHRMRMRYCVGKARDTDWPSELEDNYVPTISYKVGLCLPEACETLSFARHQRQIERLMRFNMPKHMDSRIYLHDMYCLPDRRSPIREFSFEARVFLTFCGLWVVILLASTSVYICYKRDLRNIKIAEQVRRDLEISSHTQTVIESCTKSALLDRTPVEIVSGEKGLHSSSPNGKVLCNGQQDDINYSVFDYQPKPTDIVAPDTKSSLESTKYVPSQGTYLVSINTSPHIINRQSSSVSNNNNDRHKQPAARTLTTTLRSNLSNNDDRQSNSSITSSSTFSAWLNDSPFTIRILKALSIDENIKEFQRPPMMLRTPGANRRLRINLNALDSIKCLCCILVILGHIVFIHMQHLSNIMHTIQLSFEIYPRVLIAFFNFVDTFFIISGLLTAFFIFKRFNKRTFANPLVWFSISLLRLLRLSPVYLLVFWFVKTITVHLSDGPIWDYGTDKNSIKGLCINDHWWKSILYLGNYGTMQPLCILPAWSIIVDSQYSLIIPPILFLIFKHKRLGYISLLIAIVVSTANMSMMLATQTAVKTSDMAKVRLHVYPLISRFAAEFYNTAWNRIGPVAVGILGGHMLYLYDIGTIRRWPWFMRGIWFKFILFMHLVIFVLPTLGKIMDDPESPDETDMTIFILSNATIKPIWSLINTIFLLRLVTDLRSSSVMVRLMSHNIWHCLGKLCFTSYLIHYEIILVLLKSRQEGMMDTNWPNVAREFSLAFLISTIISYFVYILYEAPINKLIMILFDRPEKFDSGKKVSGNTGEDDEDKITDDNLPSTSKNDEMSLAFDEAGSLNKVSNMKALVANGEHSNTCGHNHYRQGTNNSRDRITYSVIEQQINGVETTLDCCEQKDDDDDDDVERVDLMVIQSPTSKTSIS